MWVPRRCATAQMVSPGLACTCCPSSSKVTPGFAPCRAAGSTTVLGSLGATRSTGLTLMTDLLCRDSPGRWEQLREEANDAREGIGCSLTETANGRIPHALGQLAQQLR